MSLLRFVPSPLEAPRRIYLATPAREGRTYENYTASIANAVLVLARAGIAADQAIISRHPNVDDARNELVRDFLHRPAAAACTDIVMIDEDVGFAADAILRVVEPKRDIVAGVVPLKDDEQAFPVWIDDGGVRRVADEDGLLQVKRVGTAFLRISRGAIERLAAEAPQVEMPRHRPGNPMLPVIFERTFGPPTDDPAHAGRRIRWSGDYTFCNKARALGYAIYVDPEMHFTHAGVRVWSGCLGDWLRERAGIPHPGANPGPNPGPHPNHRDAKDA